LGEIPESQVESVAYTFLPQAFPCKGKVFTGFYDLSHYQQWGGEQATKMQN
jgi:hypothetical protein